MPRQTRISSWYVAFKYELNQEFVGKHGWLCYCLSPSACDLPGGAACLLKMQHDASRDGVYGRVKLLYVWGESRRDTSVWDRSFTACRTWPSSLSPSCEGIMANVCQVKHALLRAEEHVQRTSFDSVVDMQRVHTL